MRAQRQTAAEQQRDHLNAAIEIAERTRGEHRAGRDANERVNDVPSAIDEGNLVREKLDDVKNNCDADDPPARKHLELTRQSQVRETAEQAERRDGRVEIDSRHPRGAHRHRDC